MLSSPGTESAPASELATPLTQSGETSPLSNDEQLTNEPSLTVRKKKKKKKLKKSTLQKGATDSGVNRKDVETEARPPVLCISRNKHWKYISSYHGPWLQLPMELLDTLLTMNLNPASVSESDSLPISPLAYSSSIRKLRDRGSIGFGGPTPPESPHNTQTHLPPLPPPFPRLMPSKSSPQIDPGVFCSVINIRRFIDEASALSVRASSGLSSAELGSLRSTPAFNSNSWAAAHSLGVNTLGNANTGGRNVAMSATRIYRLRALAVQKLAQAYKLDEIASSVMVMQGGSVFDDIAERVLKVDPNDADAKYVHFFHEKIPSRQVAESTSTQILDELIAGFPQRLEYYRTRGIVHCFRDDFSQAIKDFTFALKEARKVRKAKIIHHETLSQSELRGIKQGKRRKGNSSNRTNGQAPADGTSVMEADNSDRVPPPDDIPDPIETQLLFLRGATYLQQAMYLIERTVLRLEGVSKTPSFDGADLRLCHLENGKYGGIETGNPDGPLGRCDDTKSRAYASTLGEKSFKEQICQLLKKSMRDHEKFLCHFDSFEFHDSISEGDIASQIQHALFLCESYPRPGNETNHALPMPNVPTTFMTYHPLLLESLFSVLICHLMLADFAAILPLLIRTATIVESLEGYPIFLPPRSMAQAEFLEVLERLANGWRNGTQPHSLSTQRGKSRSMVPAPPPLKRTPSLLFPSPPISRSNSTHETKDEPVAGSSSSTGFNGEYNDMCDTTPPGYPMATSQQPSHGKDSPDQRRSDAADALDCARILLAPVVKRHRDHSEKVSASGKLKNLAPINIPLHGPKVDIILAWLGAVHLPELEST